MLVHNIAHLYFIRYQYTIEAGTLEVLFLAPVVPT